MLPTLWVNPDHEAPLLVWLNRSLISSINAFLVIAINVIKLDNLCYNIHHQIDTINIVDGNLISRILIPVNDGNVTEPVYDGV
jgi:hypothetical protein